MPGLWMFAMIGLHLLSLIEALIPRKQGYIPHPGSFLCAILDVISGGNKLYKLEALTDFYKRYGAFWFDNKLYIFDPKLTQTVINKLEKGAGDYLKDSPLKDTFLGSSSRSPEVRRAIAALFRKNTIEENGHLIIKDVETMCGYLKELAQAGERVNITEWTLKMAMDVVGHMLLQLDLDALEGQQDQLLECLVTILHRCYALAEISPTSEEFVEANTKFEKITSAILTDALHKDDNSVEKRLVVKLHEACGFEQARNNMKLFLMAGSETTAATIPVLFYLLTTHTQLQDDIRQEVDDHIEAVYKDPATPLPKLEAVLKEVLRVYPIAPFISRQTTEELTVGDISIPPNTDIKAFTWGMHRSPSQWPQSKHFVPYRFLESTHSASSMYIPFGAGSRICIGLHLATLELKLATAILLRQFVFKKVHETPDLVFVTDWQHAVVHPDKDMVFRIESR